MTACLNKTEILDLNLYNQIRSEILQMKEQLPSNPKEFDVKVKLVRNQNGAIERIDYYSAENVLQKSAFYSGSELLKVKVVKRDNMILEEEWTDNKLKSRSYCNNNNELTYSVDFVYGSQDKIQRINKVIGTNKYSIEYTYDDFGRVSGRKILLNDVTMEEQQYKFDVLDRVSSYEDGSKKIFVWKRSVQNELLSYTVVDKNGNEKVITNIFDSNGYKETQIVSGERTLVVCEPRYADHSALKKPYTTEDDLNLVIAQYIAKSKKS